MTLRKKTLVVIASAVLVLAALWYLLQHLPVLSSFQQYVALGALVLIPLCSGLILLALERQVLRRVHSLGAQVDRLRESRDLSARVALGGSDDLAALADKINHMLGDLKAADDSIRQREPYLQGLSAAAQALLTPGPDIPYQAFLQALGRSSQASRVYVFLNQRASDGRSLLSQKAEWCAPGVRPQIDNPELQNLPWVASGLGRWEQVLSRGDSINGLVSSLLPSEQAALAGQDIQAILLLPLIVNGAFVGLIGFDQCAEAREWDAAEVDLLRAAAADLVQALKHKRDEQVQAAIYRISQAAQTVQNLDELFLALHAIVGELMPAGNFYIALYDAHKGLLEFPCFVDQFDQSPEPKPLGRGLTEYVLRTGQPLLADPLEFQKLLAEGQVDDIGAPSIDWLGVPLQVHDKTIGVLVVQSYTEGVRYGEQHLDILTFVSTQVAMAIERQRSEDALRQSEQKYRTIFETTGTATIIVEEDTTILLANRRFEALTGYTREEVQGRKHWTELVSPEDLPRMREYHRARRVNPEPVPQDYEFCLVNRQGQRKQVFITVAIIPGTAQSVASLQDLTERMQAQEARERLEAQLRQAQKMEAVGILAGGVAHDFNNLLTVILGNSELALAQVQADQPLHKEMSTIQRAARRGATLTRQLLAFSRRQVLQQQPLDVNQRVQALSDMLSRLIGVDISLQLDLAPHLAPVSADAVALDQVLMNLVLNARDAMPQGGTLRVATAQFTADGAYLLSHPAAHAGEYVHITVADTGMGMTREAQQHLFEPFFTTKEVGKGTGLGLSVVYGIVQQHHGWIDVTSQVGQGTQFDIYLPAADGAGESEERNVKRET